MCSLPRVAGSRVWVPTPPRPRPDGSGVDAIRAFMVSKALLNALTAAAPSRIASAFQVTDSGITPGSGVENHRRRLDEKSLGFRVVSVGVPLVVYSSTIAREFCSAAEGGAGDMIVTPKDVDILVEDCAKIISGAINGAFAVGA